MNRLWIPLLATIALTACRPGPNDSSQYIFIDEKGWNYADTLMFHPPLADSVATGALTLSLRHTNDYLYSNIWLEVTTADSLGSRVDTLQIALADDFGRWYGRGIGTDFQITDTVIPAIRLRRPVTVSVRHIMRTDLLDDIEQIGIAFNE